MRTSLLYRGDVEALFNTDTDRLDIKCLQQDVRRARSLIKESFTPPRPKYVVKLKCSYNMLHCRGLIGKSSLNTDFGLVGTRIEILQKNCKGVVGSGISVECRGLSLGDY